jgi:DNA repair protein RadD
MSFQLRDYQQEAIDELRQGYAQGNRCQMLAAATGSGKTAMASHVIETAAKKGHKSCFIVDRKVLVAQAVRHLSSLGLTVGVLQGENTSMGFQDDVVVASIQTIRTRHLPHKTAFIVIDEAHILHKAHIELIEAEELKDVPVIGLSATPLRVDLGKYFTNIVRGPSIQKLTDDGYLVPVKAFGPTEDMLKQVLDGVGTTKDDFVEKQLAKAMNQKELIGDIVDTWKRKAEGKRTLCFACDIAHSKSICDDFIAEGVSAAHVDAYTDEDERKEIFAAFEKGDITLLTSVNVLSIGFDMPIAEVGILARPTLSLAMHIQQGGRLIRPAEGKDYALILDHAGNIARHGLPTDFVVPDLTNMTRDEIFSKKNDVKMKPCSECGYMMEPGQMVCPSCGMERPTRKTEVHFIDGELVEWGTDKSVRDWDADDKCDFYLQLKNIQEERGYKPGWVAVKYKDRFKKWPPNYWEALPPIQASGATHRWVKSQQIRRAKSQAKA